MASYSQVIDIRVNGLNDLQKVEDKTKAINDLAKRLKPIPSIFDKRDGDKITKAKNDLSELLKKYADGNRVAAKFSSTIAGVNSQLNAFNSVAANASIESDQFKNALQAASRASTELLSTELARFKQLETIYTRQAGVGKQPVEAYGSSAMVSNLIKLRTEVPNSVAALELYQSELLNTQRLVNQTSQEFEELSIAIKKVDVDLGRAQFGPALPPQTSGTSAVNVRGVGGTRGAGLGGALTGAAFSLLFGGGALEAGAALTGGLIGSVFGPGGTLAGSLLGTVFGQAIADAQKFEEALKNLNVTLRSNGTSLEVTGEQVKRLAKDLGIAKEAALDLIKQFGQFQGQDATFLAETFGDLGGAATFEAIAAAGIDQETALQSIFSLRKLIGNEAAVELATSLNQNGVLTTQEKLLDAILSNKYKQSLADAASITIWDRLNALAANFNSNIKRAAEIQGILAKNGLNLKKSYEDILNLPPISPVSAEQFGADRVKVLNDKLKKDREKLLALLKDETNAQSTLNSLTDAASKKQKDRTASLAIELQLARDLAVVNDKIRAADLAEDTSLQTRLQGEAEILKLKSDIEKVKVSGAPVTEQALEIAKLDLAIAEARKNVAHDLTKIEVDRVKALEAALRPHKEEEAELQAIINGTYDQYKIEKEINDLFKSNSDITKTQAEDIVKTNASLREQAQNVLAIKQAFTDLQQNIVSEFVAALTSAFDAAVDGTKNMNDALQELTASLLAAIGQLLIFYALGSAFKALAGGDQDDKGGILTYLAKGFGFAEGGYVTSPTRATVGEGGSSEYIVPSSKMDGAMQRWNQGMRGDAVVSGAEPTSGYGGTAVAEAPTNITIEGGVLNFNDSQYIRQDQVPSIVKQASAAGEAQALRKLQMSTATRKRLGL